MLFNSYEFLFLFLPIVLIGFFWLGREHNRMAAAWLVIASLFFYGWWNPAYLNIMLGSIVFNYMIGFALNDTAALKPRKIILSYGVAVNLALLAYYKYANFFVDSLNAVIGDGFILETILLPLAISFFTFQQIAYLIDTYRNETKELNFLHYCLFVTFFPQLIAGPIVHHKEMLPQFGRSSLYTINLRRHAVGYTIFTLGLFKKVVLADGIAGYASPAFYAADSGIALTLFEAWVGSLAYTLQLYFDFSGYSDMAIGLARMFGIRLPLNFNSPYKATSIIDFWHRWHMTLSRFMRDYIYIPLGGNKIGVVGGRRTNLMITMLLGGLWHGAGWNFLFWGGLHGIYLIINNYWRASHTGKAAATFKTKFFGWSVTFVAVVFAWVPFRAETMAGTKNMLSGMLGFNGISLDPSALRALGDYGSWLLSVGVNFDGVLAHMEGVTTFYAGAWIISLLLIALVLPNTQQIMGKYHPAFETYKGEITPLRWSWIAWRPTLIWALITTVLFVFNILSLTQISEFLYFRF